MKNTLQGTSRGVDKAMDEIKDTEDKESEKTHQNSKERIQKNEDSIKSLGDNFKCTNIHIMGVSEGEERARN